MRKDQYIIKEAYRKPIRLNTLTRVKSYTKFEDTTHEFDADGYPIPEGVSLLDYKICSAILCNYSRLKQNSYGDFEGDTYYLMCAFDEVSDRALQPYPLYEKLVLYKIDGKQNIEIQQLLEEEFGIKHSLEYISSLWKNKIPKLIAS